MFFSAATHLHAANTDDENGNPATWSCDAPSSVSPPPAGKKYVALPTPSPCPSSWTDQQWVDLCHTAPGPGGTTYTFYQMKCKEKGNFYTPDIWHNCGPTFPCPP
jgi:hypothetical protein